MKIKIHESLVILLLISLFVGLFNKLLIIYLIVIMHELGHIIACYFYKRKVDKITLIPLGGIIEFENDKNTSLKEELIIILSGPLINLFIFIICMLFNISNDLSHSNKLILLINLLPIYPLDGGRILEIALMRIFSFKKSLYITSLISILFIIIIGLYSILEGVSLSIIFVLLYLLYKNLHSLRYIKERYHSFLTKKYLYPNPNLKNYFIKYYKKNIYQYFHKGVNNNLGDKEKYKNEDFLLKRYFQK